MPKFIIKGQETNNPPVLSPNLITDDGDIWLTVTTINGVQWNVVRIDSETGHLYLCGNLPKTLGLDVDEMGRVRIANLTSL